MTDKIRNYLGIAGIVALVAFALSALGYVNTYSQSVEPGSFRSFSVNGEGKVVVVPDIAQFSYSVVTEGGNNLATLQKDNTEKGNAIVSFLKEKNIDEKDIKTISYDVSPRYQNYACDYYRLSPGTVCPPATIVGYTVTQSVSVKVRDFEIIGDVLSGVVTKGANNVSSLSFTVDDRQAVEDEARAEAIEAAREKAKMTAKAGGFRLGKLLSIDDYYSPSPYYRYDAYGKGGDMVALEASSAPSVEAGSQEIIVNVSLRFEIQ